MNPYAEKATNIKRMTEILLPLINDLQFACCLNLRENVKKGTTYSWRSRSTHKYKHLNWETMTITISVISWSV